LSFVMQFLSIGSNGTPSYSTLSNRVLVLVAQQVCWLHVVPGVRTAVSQVYYVINGSATWVREVQVGIDLLVAQMAFPLVVLVNDEIVDLVALGNLASAAPGIILGTEAPLKFRRRGGGDVRHAAAA